MNKDRLNSAVSLKERFDFQDDFINKIFNILNQLETITIKGKGDYSLIIKEHSGMVEMEVIVGDKFQASRGVPLESGGESITKSIMHLKTVLKRINKEILEDIENEIEEL